MSSNFLYKYLIIHDKHKNILYGECIQWQCGEFDKQNIPPLEINLKKSYKVVLFSSNTRLELIDYSLNTLKINGLSFNFLDHGHDLITQQYDELLFNPLIDRCSKINMFYGTSYQAHDEFINERQGLFEDINKKLNLDFLKKPDIINTFTFYEPTRILVNSKFIDKYEKDEPTQLRISFFDEFKQYTNHRYKINLYIGNIKVHSESGNLSTNSFIVDINKCPDELEIEIWNINNEEIIFKSRYGFIKSISINSTIEGNTVRLKGGGLVTTHSTLSFDVGE